MESETNKLYNKRLKVPRPCNLKEYLLVVVKDDADLDLLSSLLYLCAHIDILV